LRDGVLLMLRIVGLCIAITVGVLMVVNAGFMLASPRAWFQLPGWIRAQGSLTEEKYGGGWGAAQIRITGAVMLAAVVWVLYELLARRR
jgi:drug/metabolite transporter (DMT)-like permease